MSAPTLPPKKKLPIAKLVVVGALVVVALAALVSIYGWRPLYEQGVAWLQRVIGAIRDAGPLAFFGGMALLPAAGAPLSVFGLAAGEAFAPRMTMFGVIVAAGVAIAANLALCYWLARYALRPPLARLVARYGYGVPRVTPNNALGITLIVRFSGMPFFVQNYALGLAEVPFALYLLVGWLCTMPFAAAFIILGKAFGEGNFSKIATGIGLFIAAIIVFQLARRRFAKREN